ncbi:MAG: transporter [Gammaproteobacteria bacterium]|jgi:MFS family permease|nr:transporter [Gammaproteobacteria bacterium]
MNSVASATQAMDNASLSRTHWKVWFLSAMGIFLDGFDLFIIAVALPLVAEQFTTSPAELGLIGASAPIGCILGSTIFGRFTDKLGRKTILLIDLLFFVVFAGMSALAWSVESLIFFRFLLGIGIGADYPVSSTYITENMPVRLRGRMLVSGFGFQALGALAGAVIGTIILKVHPQLDAWRYVLGIAVFPAIVILLFRLTLPESPRWLIHKGRHEEAAAVASKMTGKQINIDAVAVSSKSSFMDLFSRRYIKRTILTSMSWFLMDIAFYGVGFFTMIILAAMAFTTQGDYLARATAATHGAAFLDIFLVLGIILAIFLVDKWGRVKLQALGFFGMAIGLFVLAASALMPSHSGEIALVFGGFILFNIMANMGPNPTTFLLPAELFPTHLRATGHGFASASGKVGAAVGIFFLPVLKATIGLPITLMIIAFACLAGFVLTAALGYETKNKSLDEMERIETEMNAAEISLLHVQDDIRRLSNDLKSAEGALHTALQEIKRLKS